MLSTRLQLTYKILLTGLVIIILGSIGVKNSYAQACKGEEFLFKGAPAHNLATQAPQWCGQCPHYADLVDDRNACVSPVNFIQNVNTLIQSPNPPILLSEMDTVQWCQACRENPDTALNTNTDPSEGGTSTGGYSSGGPNDFSRLKNPLGDSSGMGSLTDFIARILNIVVMIGVPILVLAFMWVGFNYVKAQGNPSKITENHKALLAVIIGGALLLGASKLATAIKDTVEQIGTGGI